MFPSHYSLYLPLDEHAALFHLKETTLADTITRVRPTLLETLKNRWNPTNFRPTPLQSPLFPYVGLILDSTTVPVYHLKVRFEEAKQYYDKKNGVYGLKKVAVMAAAPHFALFLQKGHPGAHHDYSILKGTQQSYDTYTNKTPAETLSLYPDTDKKWAILCDNGYQGPATDTPSIRRLFVERSVTLQSLLQRNEELSKIRVPVECFFGRAKALWPLLHTRYRGDHANFDADTDICFLLTNESIKNGSPLHPEDQTFFTHTTVALQANEAQTAKRKNSMIRFKERKKVRLEGFH